MANIRLDNVDMIYPGGQVALRHLHLDVADGELLVLVGPSGCGKTTTLRLVAGLETPTRGKIILDGKDVTAVPPHQRDVAMVFQNYALYPHLTVGRNLDFPLRMQRVARAAREQRVRETARLLGLEALLDRLPGQLSGGEQQRVALGRAIVRRPRAFLLDEPLSNLDAQLRVQTRTELARLHRQLGTTMLYVTHDQEEAMTLGQRVAVLRAGELQQVAPPLDLYRRPINTFVAGFIGSPPMNLIRCGVSLHEDNIRLTASFFDLVLPGPQTLPAEIILGIRPQDIKRTSEAEADLIGQVDMIQMPGSTQVVYLNPPADRQTQALTVVVPADTPLTPQERLGLFFPRDRLHWFDGETGQRLRYNE